METLLHQPHVFNAYLRPWLPSSRKPEGKTPDDRQATGSYNPCVDTACRPTKEMDEMRTGRCRLVLERLLPYWLTLALASAPVCADDPPPTPKWFFEITRVAYTDLANTQRAQDWPEKVIADFAAAGVQMMFSRPTTASPGRDWAGKASTGNSTPPCAERWSIGKSPAEGPAIPTRTPACVASGWCTTGAGRIRI